MNVREQINAASRPYVAALFGCVAATLLALLVAETAFGVEEKRIPVWLVAPSIAFVLVIYWKIASIVRCPKCHYSLLQGRMLGWFLRVAPKVTRCPKCGLGFEARAVAEGRPESHV